jgi:bacterioferritin (cytochrome b1)
MKPYNTRTATIAKNVYGTSSITTVLCRKVGDMKTEIYTYQNQNQNQNHKHTNTVIAKLVIYEEIPDMQNESGAACGTANEELFPFALKKKHCEVDV